MASPSSSRSSSPVVPYGSAAFRDAMQAAPAGDSGRSIVFAEASEKQYQEALAELAKHGSFNIHQIDAATLVGERPMQTQGNLREMFDNAGESAAILCFENADALFRAPSSGKKADAVTPADYLFQRIEAYQGIVVLCLAEPRHIAAAQDQGVDLVVEF